MASNQLYSYNFPNAYYDLVAAYTGTVKYISSTGSNSNNGNSVTSPYLTIDYAITQNSATSRVMFVILAGTYNMTAVSGTSSSASVAIRDGGSSYERVYVCCPGQTVIQWTANTGDRDCVMVDFGNTASAIYGATLKRNNNARSGSYVVAYFKMTTKGNLYNCVLQETNANNSWSYQYDNYGYNNFAVRNCTIYNGAAPAGNYSNAGTCLTIDTVFNTTVTTGGTETNVLKSQTVNATTYVTTGVTTAGVYSGTYAWNGTMTAPLTTPAVISSSTGTLSTAGRYKYYTFTSSGNAVVGTAGIGYITIVSGGGGAGGSFGGGGGAGGVLANIQVELPAQTYTVTVGAGGAGGATVNGAQGGNSSFGAIANTVGGGYGASYASSPYTGGNGGSGGGGATSETTPDGTIALGGNAITGQGYGGGNGISRSSKYISGGGGGAGARGGDASIAANTAGNGGSGIANPVATSTLGQLVGGTYYIAGGGGGAAYTYSNGTIPGTGGQGGGGNGVGTASGTGVSGTLNTGGGGGGGGYSAGTGGTGGSGFIILAVVDPTAPGLFANTSSIYSGSSVLFELSTTGLTNGTNVAYTISGVTSAQINNAALTGNFTVSNNYANLTITTSNTITLATLSMTANTYTSNVTIAYPVSISTATIGIGYSANTNYLVNPIAGQMNIPDTVVTVAQYDKGGSTVSTFDVAGQMNINQSVVATANVGLGSSTLLPVFANMQANTIVPYTTITNKIAGPIDQGIVKLFGDNPQRELWM